jgi:hypothetical protein
MCNIWPGLVVVQGHRAMSARICEPEVGDSDGRDNKRSRLSQCYQRFPLDSKPASQVSVVSLFSPLESVLTDILNSVFERHHRFIGWLGLIATWIFVILSNGFDAQTGEWTATGYHMISTQEFWFALGMTIL